MKKTVLSDAQLNMMPHEALLALYRSLEEANANQQAQMELDIPDGEIHVHGEIDPPSGAQGLRREHAPQGAYSSSLHSRRDAGTVSAARRVCR